MNQRPAIPLWLRLVRVFHKLDHALVRDLRACDLSMAHFDVLAQLSVAEGLTQQELADHLYVTKGNICQLLDRMTQNGLLVRQQDGRTNRIYLTGSGRALIDRVLPAHENAIVDAFAALTPGEQHQLASLLRKLDHQL